MVGPGWGSGRRRCLGAVTVALALAGCTSLRPGHSPEREPGQVITADQIRRTQATNALEALELAGTFLQIHRNATGVHIILRGPNSLVLSSDCLVVVDASPLSDPGYLASIPAEEVAFIRILTGSEATLRYGTPGGAGVVEVHTQVPPDPDSAASRLPTAGVR